MNKKKEKKLTKPRYIILTGVVLAILGLAARMILVNAGYEKNDVLHWHLSWTQTLSKRGVVEIYNSNLTNLYPPIFYYAMWALLKSQELLGISGLEGWWTIVTLKLPAILFDILTCILLYTYSFYRYKNNIKKALTVAAIFFLNPAVILNSSLWGQTDSIFSFFAIAGLIALLEEHNKTGIALLTVSLMSKPQALFVAIPAGVYLLVTRSFKTWPKYILTFFLTLIIILSPYIASGQLLNLTNSMISHFKYNNRATANAFNFYSLISTSNTLTSTTTVFGLSYQTIGISISIALLTALTWLYFVSSKRNICKKQNILFLTLAWSFGMFFFYTGMHERYYHVVLLTSILGIVFSDFFLKAAFLLSISYFINVSTVFALVGTYNLALPFTIPLKIIAATVAICFLASMATNVSLILLLGKRVVTLFRPPNMYMRKDCLEFS